MDLKAIYSSKISIWTKVKLIFKWESYMEILSVSYNLTLEFARDKWVKCTLK